MPASPPDRWSEISRLLDGALDLTPAERAGFLNEACGGDLELRAEVETLMEAADKAELLESPAVAYAAPLFDPRDDDTETPPEGLIGPYRIIRELAQGGMGMVYLAGRADGQFEQYVALKLIRRGMDSDEIHRRFLAERQILARLNHPHIARLLDGGVTADGRPYFAMEYVDGVPITTYCEHRGVDLGERLRLWGDVCDAVGYAHRSLVVHRDLKPSNVLVTAAGEVKLLDFGIAKVLEGDADASGPAPATRTEHRAMTPEYASPEQVRGEPVGTSTDVYALGLVLYELLSGARAHRFERRTPVAIEREVCERAPPAPSSVAPGPRRRALRGDLDTIVLKALQKDPSRRYSTVEALHDDVRRHISGLPVRAQPDSPGYRAAKFVRRHRAGVAASAAVLLALVAGLAGTIWKSRAASLEAAKEREVKGFLVGLFQAANPEESRGQTVTAREMLETGTRRIDTALAGRPDVQAELLDVVGVIHYELGLYQRAESLHRQSVELSRALLGPGNPVVAARSTNLATALIEEGKYPEAESLLQQTLALERRSLGPNDSTLALTVENLAALFRAKGEYDRAQPLYEEALAMDKRRLGPTHPEVANDLDNLGVLLEEKGDFAGAEAAMRQALAIRRTSLPPDHPLLLTSLHNLSVSRKAQGDLKASEELDRQVLEGRRRLYPEGHPHVALALAELGQTLNAEGRWAEGEAYMVEALAMQRALLGSDHPATLRTLNNLATLRYFTGQLDSALSDLRRVVEAWSRTLGAEHPNTLTAIDNLGAVLTERGAYREAEPIVRRNVATRRRVLGNSHLGVAQSLVGLGILLERTGRRPEAEQALREAVAIYQRQLTKGHVGASKALTSLGSLLTGEGRSAEAEPLLREALTSRESAFAPGSWLTASTRRELGVCLAGLGRDVEAERLLLDSYRALASGSGYWEIKERTATLHRLVELYERRHDRRQAAKFRELVAGNRE
jgi:serine/threonine-protein kinase